MALKPADMEDCSPKKKCLGGPNNGVAYTPGDECATGYVFNSATCDCDLDSCPQCDNRGNTSYSVTFDYQKHDTAPCAGYTLDPCDSGGACPTTLELNATRNISIGGPAFSITSFVEKQRYGASNPFCPANVEPLNVTWNEGYGFGVNKIFSDGEVYDGNSTDGFIGGVSNSLWALATDENGLTWAISVHAVWVGSITSTYRAGGYFNISVTPTGTAGPLPTCPSGQIWDCETCECVAVPWAGPYVRFVGTYSVAGGAFVPYTSPWYYTGDGSRLSVAAGTGTSCINPPASYNFCGDPQFDVAGDWNTSATTQRGPSGCTGTGGSIVINQWYGASPVARATIYGGMDCAAPTGTEAVVSGAWESTDTP